MGGSIRRGVEGVSAEIVAARGERGKGSIRRGVEGVSAEFVAARGNGR